MKRNKLLLLLLSVVISFALWLYVITVVSPESEDTFYNVPVVLQGDTVLNDRGFMLLMEEKPTVTLTLTGNRSDLIKLNSSNITLTADLSKIYEEGEHELLYSISYPGDVPSGAVAVMRKDPGSIPVTVERKITDKPVDVVIDDGGTNVGKGYLIQDTKLDYEQILISGPASVVNDIAMARINVDYTDRTKTFGEDFFITLCDEEGNPVDSKWVEVDRSSVFLEVVVHQVKEIPLTVTVVEGGGATLETTKVTVDPQIITVSGTEADLKDLEELDLGKVDLSEYDADTELEFEIKLPSGVEAVDDTTTAKVTVDFLDLEIREMTVTRFETKNVPEGMEAKVMVKELKISIRGPKLVVDNLAEEDVWIVVDLTDAKTGNSNVDAQVVVANAKNSGAGALGKYQVLISLTEEEE